jgi:ABC-type transport system substrate-binding protein
MAASKTADLPRGAEVAPFKFVEFKPNEYIKVERNSDYWKRDRPYLDERVFEW